MGDVTDVHSLEGVASTCGNDAELEGESVLTRYHIVGKGESVVESNVKQLE